MCPHDDHGTNDELKQDQSAYNDSAAGSSCISLRVHTGSPVGDASVVRRPVQRGGGGDDGAAGSSCISLRVHTGSPAGDASVVSRPIKKANMEQDLKAKSSYKRRKIQCEPHARKQEVVHRTAQENSADKPVDNIVTELSCHENLDWHVSHLMR